MNKIDCAKETHRILDLLEDDFFDDIIIERECLDSWDENHSVFMITLMEEDYRDYDALMDDIFNKIKKELNQGVVLLYNDNYPQNGYALRVYPKFSGLAFEFELHKVENGKPI